MEMKNINETSDLPTAATLLLLKHRLLSVDKSNPRRAVFIFEKSTELEEHIQQINQGDMRVDPVDFWNAERRCKQYIYQSSGGGL